MIVAPDAVMAFAVTAEMTGGRGLSTVTDTEVVADPPCEFDATAVSA
jgi:hypothetical protein